MKHLSLLIILFFFFFSGMGIAQVLYPGSAEIIGSEEIVFDWDQNAVQDEDIPDAPARAFRDADGKIQLIASHYISYRMIGDDFNSLVRDTTVIFNSDNDPDPAHYNNLEWIRGVYTTDGKTIHAIIHNEYLPFGPEFYETDYFNSLTYAVSNDTGRSYTQASAPDHFLATIPYQYTSGHPMGIFNGSNIIYNPEDGYYYRMVHLEEHQLQDWGAGVIRTQTLDDPRSWRGWDGEGYNVTFVDPYNESGFDPAEHILAPVSRDNIGKMSDCLVYSTYFEQYVVVGTHVKYNAYRGEDVTGFYYSISEDLINWSAPILIWETQGDWTVGGELYPTLIDHSDTTRNFEQIGQEAYLYFTRWNSGSYDRDLVRVPIRFHKNIISQFTVNSAEDYEDADIGDGIPFTGYYNTNNDSIFTLRAVLQEVNASPDTDYVFSISFNIPGDGPHILQPSYFLPELEVPVIIDGYTQPGASENTQSFHEGNNATIMIELDGSNSGGATGIALYCGNSIVKGLAIHSFGSAIEIAGKGNNVIQGNFIGLNALGNAVGDPIDITITDSHDNLIGGVSPEHQNVISGSIVITGSGSYGNTVKNNYLGTDATGSTTTGTGTIAISNGAHDNIIGGADGCNLISGTYRGVDISGSGTSANQVLNNLIGTDKTGTTAQYSGLTGIQIYNGATDNIIGSPGLGNVISGWTNTAVIIEGSGTSGNIFQGNFIGSAGDGITDIGNQYHAIEILDNASGNEIGGINQGEGNVIAYNDGTAIRLGENAGTGNAFPGNLIFDNEFGIDLYPYGVTENDEGDVDTGPNNLQNYPEIIFAYAENDTVTIRGELQSAANTTYRIEFFASSEKDATGYGQGERYIGSADLTTDDSGQADFEVNLADTVSGGSYITCTATDPNNNTSEFSAAMVVQSPTQYADIQISPDSFSITLDPGITVTQTVDIQNTGTVELVWYAENDADWLVNHPYEGTIQGGGSGYTNFDMNTTGMAAGDYTGIISIYSNDPDEPVVTATVQLTVNEYVGFAVSPEQFNVSVPLGEVSSDSLVIENTGNSQLGWTISSDADWLSAVPDSGVIPVSQSSGVEIQFDATGLTVGDYSGNLTVIANDDNNTSITIPVNMTVSANSDIFVIPDSFNVTIQQGIYKTISFTIRNDGTSDLTCTVGNDFESPWLNPDPRNPDPIAPGDSINVNVTINGTVLTEGNDDGVVFINSNDPDEPLVLIPVLVTVLSAGATPAISITFPENDATIDTNEVEAEFTVENFIVGSPIYGNDGYVRWSLDDNPAEDLYEVTPIVLEELPEGEHELKVWLVDNYGQPFVPDVLASVTFTVDYLKPEFSLSSLNINAASCYGIALDTAFYVINTGLDILTWEIASAPGWVEFSATAGELTPGDSDLVEISFQSDSLFPGEHSGNIIFQSDDPVNPELTLDMSLTIESPELAISPGMLQYSLHAGDVYRDTLNFLNSGTCPLEWQVSVSGNWIVPDTTEGIVPSVYTYLMTFRIVTEGLEPGEYQDTLTFYTNDPLSEVIKIPASLSLLAPQGLDELSGIPDEFALRQNFPNPFNPETTIRFDLPANAFVHLSIYDLLGREVAVLINEHKPAGYHSLIWDGRNRAGAPVHSGIYIYRISALSDTGDRFDAFKKLILLK